MTDRSSGERTDRSSGERTDRSSGEQRAGTDEPTGSGGALADLGAALEVVGPRWALLVVACLLEGPMRYGDLQRRLGAPTNMLAARLRELQAAGVLFRLPLAHNQRAYALTDRGRDLARAVEALVQWGAAGPREPSAGE